MKNFINITKKLQSLTKGAIDFDKHNQISIVHHSNSIEGSTLTEGDTYLLLEKGLTPKGKPVEHSLMAIDHFEAIKYVYKLAKEKKPITVQEVQMISSLLLKKTGKIHSNIMGTWDESKGEFRKHTVFNSQRVFANQSKIKQQVSSLCEYLNDNILLPDTKSVYDLSFNVHFNMVSIHPFSDGNGRLSRLLMNYVQMYHNKPLSIVFQVDKIDYFNVLEQSRKEESIKPFNDFMYAQSLKHFKAQINDLKPKNNKNLTMLF